MKFAIAHYSWTTGHGYWHFVAFDLEEPMTWLLLNNIAEGDYSNISNIEEINFGDSSQQRAVAVASAASTESAILVDGEGNDHTPHEWNRNMEEFFDQSELDVQREKLIKFVKNADVGESEVEP